MTWLLRLAFLYTDNDGVLLLMLKNKFKQKPAGCVLLKFSYYYKSYAKVIKPICIVL